MGIVPDRQPEMPDRGGAGKFDDIFAGAHQLDDAQRKVGKGPGIRGLGRDQELLEGFGVGVGGERGAAAGGQLDNQIPMFGRAHDSPQGGPVPGEAR